MIKMQIVLDDEKILRGKKNGLVEIHATLDEY